MDLDARALSHGRSASTTGRMTILIPEDGQRGSKLMSSVATLVMATGMASLDTTIGATALPTIAADLNTSPADSVWVVNAHRARTGVGLGYGHLFPGGRQRGQFHAAGCQGASAG